MLIKKTLQFIAVVFIFLTSSFLSALDVEASGGYYTYRSTVFGPGINQTGQYVYEIQGQKNRFSVGESPFFLTRIFNITNVTSFSFKHEIRGAGVYREFYSDYYTPNKNWWAEIYYWKEIGQLPAGTYETKIYLNIDNEGYKLRDTKNFTVENTYSYSPYYSDSYQNQNYVPYNYNYNYDYNNYNNYSYNQPYYIEPQHYSYNWTHTGKNIRKTGDYSYELVSQATEFSTSEDVYALAYLTDIRGIDSFAIKFEVWRDGGSLQKTNEVPKLWPHRENWAYNYSWGNLGKLSQGVYQIKTYIQLDGGYYRYLNSQQINVGRVLSGYENRYQDNRFSDRNDYRDRDNYRDVESYKYEYTKFGTDVKNDGGYDYSVVDSKTTFYTDEDIKALTRVSEIRGIEKFRIKYKVYLENTLKREYTASEQTPNRNRWNYNYSSYNFGKMTTAGSYTVKVFISVDGGTYKLLDTKTLTVKEKSTRYNYYDYNRDYRDSRSYSCYYGQSCYDSYNRYGTDTPYYSNSYNRPYSPYYR